MSGEEEQDEEFVQVHENGTNVICCKVHGTVMQFDRLDGDFVFGHGQVVVENPDKSDD